LRIVDLTEFWSERGGGVRTYLTHMLREGTASGHEVTVVAPGPRAETTELNGGRLLRIPGPRMPYDRTYHALFRVREAARIVRDLRPDVLQSSSPFLAGWIAARMSDVPVRAFVGHADLVGAYLRPTLEQVVERPSDRLFSPAWAYLRALTRRFDVTVVAGPWMADPMSDHGCPRVEVVPFGIDRTELGPHMHDAALRRELLGEIADREGAALLVCAGRLAFEKRVRLVIDAARELQPSRPVALAILGEGPEKARLQRRARGLPVRFLGFKKDEGRRYFARVMASADALVHGSAAETFGFTLAEALVSGTPIVVADAGAAFFQGDASCREVYPAYGGSSEIAAAIRRLLGGPRALQRAASLRWASAIPSLSDHFANLFALYARMLRDKS